MPDPFDHKRIAPVVIGTAGHIDHGKSTLVKRLSGVDPDRLPEEKARALTIDLGFAPLRLPDGRIVGIIDVPGHERLIKNMVAGATGIDIALLVVDANEGVMPQTREHVEVLGLLGVQRGLIALTKIDLAGAELAELAAEDVRDAFRDTFLREAPLFPVSALTGEGIEPLLRGLRAAVKSARPRRPSGPFRMPIQRVFSAKGFGTVVTGVPLSGRVRPGDTLEIAPAGLRGRVRRIQAYRHQIQEARAGHSTALNLADVDYKSVRRGMVAAEPGAFRGARLVEGNLRLLRGARRPLRHLEEVRVHLGTAEVLGRVATLRERELAPGEAGPVQLRLREPVVCVPGDRFILRRHAEPRTIGGGEVLGTSEHRLKTGKAFVLEALGRKESAVREPVALVEETLRSAGCEGCSPEALRVQTGLGTEELERLLDQLRERGVVRRAPSARLLLHEEGLALATERVMRTVEALYEEDPLRVHVERLTVREAARLPDPVFVLAVETLCAARRLGREGAARLTKLGRAVSLTREQERVRARIVEGFERDPERPPSERELRDQAADLHPPPRAIRGLLGVLCEQGVLVHIGGGMHFLSEALDAFRARLVEAFGGGEPFTASQARERLATTRKYAIPLLEHFDREGLTRRDGALRTIVREG